MKLYKLKIGFISLILAMLTICDLKIYSESEILITSPFSINSEENAVFATSPAPLDKLDKIYGRYHPFAESNLMQEEENILTGPSGPPIGGLPIRDSYICMMAMIFVYVIYKIIKRKKTSTPL